MFTSALGDKFQDKSVAAEAIFDSKPQPGQFYDRELLLSGLLGTPKGIAALTEFLSKTCAFTFSGENIMPKAMPTFLDEPEPPDIDFEDEEASDSN